MKSDERTLANEYIDMILEHFASRLSKWEDVFVRSLSERLRQGQALTTRQLGVLDRLMERVASQHVGRFVGREPS